MTPCKFEGELNPFGEVWYSHIRQWGRCLLSKAALPYNVIFVLLGYYTALIGN
jgi:hypothetical protein